MSDSVLRLVAERDLEARCFKVALLPIRTTNDEFSTSTIFATNRCYVLGGLSALNLILKRCQIQKLARDVKVKATMKH